MVTGTTASDLDPQGEPPEENPDLAGNVVDGDPATTWRTSTYSQQFGPGGLKTGVGVVIDLGEVRDVRSVEVDPGRPAHRRTRSTSPTRSRPASPASSPSRPRPSTARRSTADVEASGQYVVVWLTALPAVDGGFRGQIGEVVVRAA